MPEVVTGTAGANRDLPRDVAAGRAFRVGAAHDHVFDLGRIERARDRWRGASAWPPIVAPWVMLKAPRQLLQSGVRAVETMTASAYPSSGVHHISASRGCIGRAMFTRANAHWRSLGDHGPRSVARARRAVRLDDARRLRRRDHQDRAARRRDRARLGAAVLRRRDRLLRQPESQQEERRDRPEASRRARRCSSGCSTRADVVLENLRVGTRGASSASTTSARASAQPRHHLLLDLRASARTARIAIAPRSTWSCRPRAA